LGTTNVDCTREIKGIRKHNILKNTQSKSVVGRWRLSLLDDSACGTHAAIGDTQATDRLS
jgi:hypothetical protein